MHKFAFAKHAALTVALLAVPAVALAADGAPAKWGAGASDAAFAQMLKTSFQAKGIAKLDRLTQDETQAFCSNPGFANSKDGVATATKIEAANLATVKWPADGNFMGDWKKGEKLAQSGRGLTWTDKADQANGGNCYNCHQITPQEIAFGTIGPSLLGYGKTRGSDEATMRTVWAKVYNAKAANACSNMPRAGYHGIISESDIKDLVALLLDPASPVNK